MSKESSVIATLKNKISLADIIVESVFAAIFAVVVDPWSPFWTFMLRFGWIIGLMIGVTLLFVFVFRALVKEVGLSKHGIVVSVIVGMLGALVWPSAWGNPFIAFC